MKFSKNTIDLFTDTAAILNYFDLRSIMGCPRGHEHDSIYSLSITNVVFHCIFHGEQAIIDTSNPGTTIFIPIRILF